uniref:Uncharacterized protein n=1 Tax=Aegilops tauschii subsp. strangulata TaxID=200361 RepID=A0A453BHV9_AEGTS
MNMHALSTEMHGYDVFYLPCCNSCLCQSCDKIVVFLFMWKQQNEIGIIMRSHSCSD